MKSCMDTIHYPLFTLPVSPNLKPGRRASEPKHLHTGLLRQESSHGNADNLAVSYKPTVPETQRRLITIFLSYIVNSPHFIQAFLHSNIITTTLSKTSEQQLWCDRMEIAFFYQHKHQQVLGRQLEASMLSSAALALKNPGWEPHSPLFRTPLSLTS